MAAIADAGAPHEPPIRILLLEDNDFDAELIGEMLVKIEAGSVITRVLGREGFEAALADGEFDIILADYSLPGFDGLSALDMARDQQPNLPFILVSGVLGEEVAIDALRRGATDYVLKQRLIRLPSAVERAVREAQAMSDRRRAEEQKELLVHELSHRVKNTLAVIASIIRNTARHSRDAADLEERLLGRIHAMSEAHALLFKANWGKTDLKTVISRILKPYARRDSGQVVIEGMPLALEPNAALTLGMIFHELATNAMKYGALSLPTGRVTIDWTLSSAPDGGRAVELSWKERGGPPVSKPTRHGFGSTLITRSAGSEFGGEANLSFEPEGVELKLSFPVTYRQG